MDTKKVIAAVFGGVLLSIGLALFMALPIKWCWNYVMPYLFGLKTLSWGQAWCLTFLTSVLIKSTQTVKE
jgi:hypothetical protein